MSPQPQPKNVEIVERINRLHEGTDKYASAKDFQYLAILRDCDSLIEAYPKLGYRTRGMARSIVGDENGARSDFSNAVRLAGGNAGDEEYAWANFLALVGRNSEAIDMFMRAADPRSGHFIERHEMAVRLGALQWLNQAIREAMAMNIGYEPSEDVRGASRYAEFLAQRGVSDHKLASIYDVAGDVAREHGARLGGCHLRLADLDGEQNLIVRFYQSLDPEELADMNDELCWRLASDASIPSDIVMSFEVE